MHNAKIGAKANSLNILIKAGYNVPAFFTIDSRDLSINTEKIKSCLPKITTFAVRSSAAGEDSSEKSFAGHFYSAIGISIDKVADELNKVVDSYKGLEGGVIIQEFISSDKAGVIFSDAGDGKVVINSNFGLCDSVVKGEKCDEYILDKKGLVISKNIADKSPHFFENQEIIIKSSTQIESLEPTDVLELVKVARSIQNLMGTPQDIEWCFKGKKLYILQSRPVTRRVFNKKVTYFDSANIAESYSGIVLPLTCSYASFVYKKVYEDLLAHSGVPRKMIAKHQDVFSNMLGFFYGRMYYNMNNWYKMMAFLPGYKRNKKNLELMITSNINEEVDHNIQPSVLLKIMYPFLSVVKLLFLPSTILRFQRHTGAALKEAHHLPIGKFAFEESREKYLSLIQKLLKNWYITVENDVVVMTCFGILKKVYGDEIVNSIIHFKSASSKQIGELSKLSASIQTAPVLWKAIETQNRDSFYQELGRYPSIENHLKGYYEKFGGRFANELKLESPDLEEDFKKFAQIIHLYSQLNTRQTFSPIIALPGNFLKRFFMKVVLKKFKKFSSQREELRLLRSNSFAVVRKLFNRTGEAFADKKVILEKEDIFYLTVDEIFSFSKLEDVPIMIDVVKNRKSEYELYKSIEPLSHFALHEGESAPLLQAQSFSGKTLKGRPCTSGIVRGKVRLFRDFTVPDKIDFDIVVASHTDPGWTALIGVAKGLIIEHGGVLSHASIVSRELGIPTVIGAEGALDIFKDGQMVELNGSTGTIRIL